MEEILFNDSSSGESDNEDTQSKKQPQHQPAPRSVPPTTAPSASTQPPTSSSKTSGMTASEQQKQLLKQLYSPANSKPRPSQPQQQTQSMPQPTQQHQPMVPQPMQAPPKQQRPSHSSQMQQPPHSSQMQQPSHSSQMQQPPHPSQMQQPRAPHPGPVQQKPKNLGMMPHQHPQRTTSASVRMSQGVPQNQQQMGQPQPNMSIPQRTSSSGMPHPGRMASSMSHAIRKPGPMPSQRATSDPFEPTPVVQMMSPGSSHHHHQQRPMSAAPQAQPPTFQQRPPGSGGVEDRQAMEKKQKERFIVFTRVLMKYLEQKDTKLHLQVKEIIKDCAERNKKKERGYESVTAAMRKRLKEVVPDPYWKRAEAYMMQLVKKQNRADPNRPGGSSVRPAPGRPNPMAMQPRGGSHHMSTSSSKPQQPQPQPQRQPQQQTKPSQVLNNIREDLSKKQRPVPKTPAPSFQAPQPKPKAKIDTEKNPPSIRSTQKNPRRPSDTTDNSSSVPRDYNELLPMVDSATNYDRTTAGSLLGGSKTQSMLSEEQTKLLSDYRVVVPSTKDNGGESFPIYGWNNRNLVSTRVAWARLRASSKTTAETKWVNEDTAEDEQALAVLSEGAQIYIKSVLKKALHSARQRHNFEGKRVWYQQKAQEKPEFSVRLGCDVNRQLALAQGNACMTSKRMEEALARQPHVSAAEKEINDETLESAVSMSDLAVTPSLGKAVDNLTEAGKRNFEVHGGKESREPPFGRMPKQTKVELVDFVTGMNFSRRRGGQRATALNSAFSF